MKCDRYRLGFDIEGFHQILQPFFISHFIKYSPCITVQRSNCGDSMLDRNSKYKGTYALLENSKENSWNENTHFFFKKGENRTSLFIYYS